MSKRERERERQKERVRESEQPKHLKHLRAFSKIDGYTYCNTLQRTATHCNTLQHTATHCNTLQHTATHCSTLQHTAIHFNTLHHTATHCNTLQHTRTQRKNKVRRDRDTRNLKCSSQCVPHLIKTKKNKKKRGGRRGMCSRD